MMEDSRKLLEPHKYPCKGSTEGLKYFALRALRCLPSYERHKVSELRLLAHQRGIDVATKAIRKQMIEALCLADENSHFERFLDLPAELRERIYVLRRLRGRSARQFDIPSSGTPRQTVPRQITSYLLQRLHIWHGFDGR
jgi:hypothetical protein